MIKIFKSLKNNQKEDYDISYFPFGIESLGKCMMK